MSEPIYDGHFSAHAEGTGVTSDVADEALAGRASNPRWLELRRTMLTASDSAALLGEDDHRGAIDVYADKLAEPRGEALLALDDPRFWGKILEQPILSAVARYHGWKYHPGGHLLRSRAHPQLGATLDAEVQRGGGDVWEPFEGKTTRVPRGWSQDDDELPTRVLIQVQHQLLVTGAPSAPVFALLQGSRPCLVEVSASVAFHAVLVEASEEFFERLRKLEPPPATWRKSEKRTLERLYPQHEELTAVALPAEAVDWTRELQEISTQLKALERRDEELRNLLRASIGSATFGLLAETVNGKSCWRWQQQEKRAYTVEASSSRVLLALKHVPLLSGPPQLPQAGPSLSDLLERSSLGETTLEPFATKKRRRARR